MTAERQQEFDALFAEAGSQVSRDQLAQELRAPKSAATGAFAEWLLVGASAILKQQEQAVADLSAEAVDQYQHDRYDQGLATAQAAVELAFSHFRKDHPAATASLSNLALLHWAMGHFAEAEPIYREVLDIRRHTLSARDPSVARTLSNLAEVLVSMGRRDEAEPLFVEAVSIDEKRANGNNPDYASDLNNLGALYKAKGDYERASALYQKALEIFEATRGSESVEVATTLMNDNYTSRPATRGFRVSI